MKKVLKWIGIVLGVLVVLLVAAGLFLYISGNSTINKTYDVQVGKIEVPDDAASIERGQHLAEVTCSGCHGEDYAGTPFLDDPTLGYIPSSNLTSGASGIGGGYSDEDWVRAIRHGIAKDGKSLIIMPSNATYYYSDEDLGALIAFMKSLPAVDNDLGEKAISVPAVLLVGAGPLKGMFPASIIDHEAPRPSVPNAGVTAEYGEYLVKVNDCKVCHAPDMKGGVSPAPGEPMGTDITSTGLIGTYQTEDDFLTFFRTGMTPYNKAVDNKVMPWEHFGLMTDEELTAIYLYLQSLP
jgi:mono/diheme cytochrome c family protein